MFTASHLSRRDGPEVPIVVRRSVVSRVSMALAVLSVLGCGSGKVPIAAPREPGDVPALVRRLSPPTSIPGDSEWESVVELLKARGRGVVPELIAELPRAPSGAKLAILDVLARMGPEAEDCVPSLLELFDRDPLDAPLKLGLVDALGRLGASARAAVPLLVRCLEINEPATPLGLKAQAALIRIGDGAREVLPRIRELWRQGDTETRANAAAVIAALGTEEEAQAEAIPFLIRCARESAALSLAAHATRLASVGQRAVPRLANLLATDAPACMRALAATALGLMDRLPDAERERLRNAMEDDDLAVRVAAAAGFVGKDVTPESEARANEVLLGAIQDEDLSVRALAMGALINAHSMSRPDRLSALLEDSRPGVRAAACGLLSVLERNLVRRLRVVDQLSKLLGDTDVHVRVKALEALARLEPLPAEVLAQIVRSSSDPDDRISESAVATLRRIGPTALPEIRRFLQARPPSEHATAAVEGLVRELENRGRR